MTKDKVKEILEATKYGSASSNVDNINGSEVTKEEINYIFESIINGRSDSSFLYDLVNELKKEKLDDGKENHRQNR